MSGLSLVFNWEVSPRAWDELRMFFPIVVLGLVVRWCTAPLRRERSR